MKDSICAWFYAIWLLVSGIVFSIAGIAVAIFILVKTGLI